MKKNILFAVSLVCLLGVAGLAGAAMITLPNPLGDTNTLPELVAKISEFIMGVIGSIAVIVFVYSGILFLTSGGDQPKVTHAKHALIYAAIGLAVALLGEGLAKVIEAVIGA